MDNYERIAFNKGCVSKEIQPYYFDSNLFMNNLIVESPAFAEGSNIPEKYSCKGENINPPLAIRSIPPGMVSLAIIVEDPDAPSGVFDHWVAWNLPPVKEIAENSKEGVQGNNGKGKLGYTGPCPPSGTHRYQFKVYALDTMINMPVGTNKTNLLNILREHVMAAGELTGLFSAVSPVSA
jgi:Raf kinase inhibitor-like YbhB/YbcL family protein